MKLQTAYARRGFIAYHGICSILRSHRKGGLKTMSSLTGVIEILDEKKTTATN
jgi:hypothetical protein